MKNKDKVLVAFLIAVGLFSTAQAIRYVGSLSDKQKKAFEPVILNSHKQLMINAVCSSIVASGETGTGTKNNNAG